MSVMNGRRLLFGAAAGLAGVTVGGGIAAAQTDDDTGTDDTVVEQDSTTDTTTPADDSTPSDDSTPAPSNGSRPEGERDGDC